MCVLWRLLWWHSTSIQDFINADDVFFLHSSLYHFKLSRPTRSSLDSSAGSNKETELSCALCCISHGLLVLVCVFIPFFAQLQLKRNFFCQQWDRSLFLGFFFFVCACFCWSLLSELKLPLHIQKSPLMCHFEARHSESVSLATERWFLHSGWPPRAAGCWQIAVGWQIRSCAPLICTVGPLALLCFVSQSLNSADDRRQPGTGWAIVVSRRFLESLSSCPKCVFTCNVWSCVFTKWSLLWFLSPSPSDSSNPYP